MEVYLAGKKLRISPTQSIGKGGEADIFDIGNDLALKIFKGPSHQDYQGLIPEQAAARDRLQEHQTKLREFPKNLPPAVVVPLELATDQNGQKVLGYSMRLIKNAEVLMRYSEQSFRNAGIAQETVIKIFQKLHGAVSGIHNANVIIGDFNDLNILISATDAYLIDADSFQFGSFPCRVFTTRFLDPLLGDPSGHNFIPAKIFGADSDWYAYAVMLMQCLLFVHPYGGIYRPKNLKERIAHELRPLKRISVFHPEVQYPKPALKLTVLPDEILHHLELIFTKDQRGIFPVALLETLHWTRCTNCRQEFARTHCPYCTVVTPAALKEVTVVRGQVVSTKIFSTTGTILHACYQRGKLRWLYHEGDEFRRETGATILKGELDPFMRFRIRENSTLIGKTGVVVTISPGEEPTRLGVDSYGTLPIFDANPEFRYWLCGGKLMRDGSLGPDYPEHIGCVLAGQTLFGVGPEFGFGFYRAGELSQAFVFDAKGRNINDRVNLPLIKGKLIDTTSVFSDEYCWFFMSIQEGSEIINHCRVINSRGAMEAEAKTQQNDGSWLGTIRGKSAVGNFLLAATDEGIVRVEMQKGKLIKTREFPDTEPFIDSSVNLFAGREGLYVVSKHDIKLLKIN